MLFLMNLTEPSRKRQLTPPECHELAPIMFVQPELPPHDLVLGSVVWQYVGMPADEMESRIVLVNERVLTTSVNDIEHIESQSLAGVAVIRIYFRPGAKIAEAEAQVTATSQAILKALPTGITPPYIVRYSATSVPIIQISVSSDTLTEQQLYDLLRTRLPQTTVVSIAHIYISWSLARW